MTIQTTDEGQSGLRRATGLSFQRDQEDDNRITFSLSSEEPYQRWRGMEILVHTKDAVDLSFLNSGAAPLLLNHESYEQPIGVVEKAWLGDDNRVYVTARFSKRALAQEIKQDVSDKIMTNVSVGYNIDRDSITFDERGEDDPVVYRVHSWKPMEASIVSIPADTTVGVGRSTSAEGGQQMPPEQLEAGATPNGTEGQRMPSALPATPAPADPAPVNVMTPEARAAENAAQVEEITALAQSHNRNDLALEYIGAAMGRGAMPSLAEFRGIMRGVLPEDKPLVNEEVGLSQAERQDFSIVRLARAMRDGATDADERAAQFEIEACDQAATNHEGTTRGYRIPQEVMTNWGDVRDANGVTTAQYRAAMATGGNPNVQDVDHLASRFIDNLRNRSSIMRAGATMLTGLSGNVEIPGGANNIAAAWLGTEDADVAESVPTFRKVELQIKDLGAFTDMTRRMLIQSTIDIELYVRSQLITAMALAIDSAALEGAGAGGVPEGLKNTTGIGSVTFAAPIPTRAEIIDMWAEVATENADIGALNFILNSTMAAGLMKALVDAGSGRFVMESPDGPVAGMAPAIRSEQVTDGDLYFGNFNDFMVGMWGGLDLERSTEAKFLSGGLRLRAIQSVDTAVARVGSFALGNDG